jgi:hypothetical protein
MLRLSAGVGEIAAEMSAAAFLAPQGRDSDHEPNDSRIGERAVSGGKRQERRDRRS